MDKEYLEFLGKCSLVGAAIGAFIGLGLSFTTLSPLVIGGIVGFASITALYTRFFLLCSEIIKGEEFVVAVIAGASLTIAAAGGVALGVAAHSLFPGAMFSAWPAILVGAAIGAVGVASLLPVGDYIIGPVVEKVADAFRGKAPAN